MCYRSYGMLLFNLKVDGELRTYGSATELTGSTATVIMIKHGDLLCANLGKYIQIIYRLLKLYTSILENDMYIHGVLLLFCVKVIQEQSDTYLVELKTFLRITIPAIQKKEKEFIPWVELSKTTGESLDLSN